MVVQTKESQAEITPKMSLEILKEGNRRFQLNSKLNRDLLDQVCDTADGQFPFATILSCIDSRVPAETIFDTGIGDIFNVRIAGNFVNNDILGSIEFACKLAGTKLVLVLGHSACGAVKGACDNAELGNLTGLLDKLKPAVEAVKSPSLKKLRNSENINFVNEVSKKNIDLTIENIKSQSSVLAEMEKNGEIEIVGAYYDIRSGKVEFN